jgi:hypothetical protein
MTTFFPPAGAGANTYDPLRVRVTASGSAGIVSLTARRYHQRTGSDKTWASKSLPLDFKLVYYLDGKPISGVLGSPYTFMLDTRGYEDGLHAVWVVLVDGTDVHKVRSIGSTLKINNLGMIDGVGKAPTFGLENRGANFHSPLPDWVEIPTSRPAQTVTNYPYVASPPAHTMPDPSVMKNTRNWIVEPIAQLTSGLYQGTPSWYLDAEGWPYIDMAYFHSQPEIEPAMKRSWLNDFHDGERNNSATNPYSTLAFCKFGKKLFGLGVQGDFWEMNTDGAKKTLYGPRGDPTAIPPKDSRAFYDEEVGIGMNGEHDEFDCCIDFTQSLTVQDDWFVADMEHGRIVKIDTSATPAKLSVYVDGLPSVASLFITPDGTIVATLMPRVADGITYEAGLVVIDPQKQVRHLKIDLPGLATPMCVRPTSDYKAIVADQTGNWIYEIDPVTNESRCIASPKPQTGIAEIMPVEIAQQPSAPHTNWSWIDVDRLGTCGPVDDIFFVQYRGGGNNYAVRIPRYNTKPGPAAPIQNSSNGYVRVGAAEYVHEWTGHYPWAVAISPHEARMAFYGGGGDGVLMVRGRMPSDPKASFDITAYNLGRAVFGWGTIEGFPFGIRPSFTALYNHYGHQKLGLKTFDELAAMDDLTLATYIRDGLGGTTARPEIVGYPLACLMYFIRKNSILALAKAIPAPAKPADKIFPVISDVFAERFGDDTARITWTTNEPTLGYVAFGKNTNYHRWSEPEFGLTHQVMLKHLSSSVQFSIRAADTAGNVTFGPNMILT